LTAYDGTVPSLAPGTSAPGYDSLFRGNDGKRKTQECHGNQNESTNQTNHSSKNDGIGCDAIKVNQPIRRLKLQNQMKKAMRLPSSRE